MSRRTQKNVGVIGLGIIGSRIADHLRRRGFHVFVWNRTPRPFPNFVGSRSEIAELCDFIQIFVSDDDALLDTVAKLQRSLKEHHVVMAHSTVAPHTMRAAAEIVQRRGAQLLDVPFTGSKLAAEKGELVYYAGGDAAALQRARPVLAASSKEIIEMGDVGHATTVKLATNLITATTVQATAEALALVTSAGLLPEKFEAAMRGNASQSATLAMKLPKMLAGDFEPHFSVKHMLKDVQIVSRLARSHDLDLGVSEAARAALRREVEEGRGNLDYSSVVHGFFPDGVPARQRSDDESEDEQPTLGGLDESSAAPEPAAAPVENLEPPAADRAVAAAAKPEKADDPDEENASVADDQPSDESPVPATEPDEPPPPAPQISEDETVVEQERSSDTADDPDEIQDADESSAEVEPERVAIGGAAPEGEHPTNGDGEAQPRRNLFSRMFGKSGDY